jgi:ketosteroid isomerase-like protein
VARVLEMASRTVELSGGTYRLELHDAVAGDEHAVALFMARGERAGRRLEDSAVVVFHVRDGKAAEMWFYPADLYANDEFWS